MNSTVYLFGDFAKGYSQYPQDYTQRIFDNFYKKAKANTQVVVHRNDSLMYYGYIRKLPQKGSYFGICILLNDAMFSDIKTLFTYFEHLFTDIVKRGEILEFTNNGSIVSKVQSLSEKQYECERIAEKVQSDFAKLAMQKLLPVKYSVANDDYQEFSIDDTTDTIIESTYSNGYTYIYKAQDYDTPLLQSYSNKLRRLNDELKEKDTEISKLNRQKKNIILVLILSFVLFAGAVSFVFFWVSTDEEISRLQCTVSDYEIKNKELITENENLITEKQRLITEKRRLITEKEELRVSKETLASENAQLGDKISRLQKTIDKNDAAIKKLQNEKEKLVWDTKKLNNDIDNLRLEKKRLNDIVSANKNVSTTKRYKIYAKGSEKVYCYYYKCKDNFYRTGCYYSDNEEIDVYYMSGDYALTQKGYVRIKDIRPIK